MNTIEVFVDVDIVDVVSVYCDMSLDCLNTMNNDLLSMSEELFPQDGVYTMEVIFHPAEYYQGGLVNGSWYDFRQIDYKAFEEFNLI